LGGTSHHFHEVGRSVTLNLGNGERPIRVLLVEDQLAHVKLISRALHESAQPFTVVHVSTLNDARRLAQESRPDLAIVDLMLPDGRGTDLLEGREPLRYPVIILTSQGDERAAVQAIKLGASDYVIKSAPVMADMPNIVRRALREWQLFQDRDAALKALAENDRIFRQLADNIRDLFWLYDWIERRLLYVSPAYEAVWGRPATGLIENPSSWLERVHEDDRERAIQMEPPTQPGKFYDLVYRILRPDGSLRWIHDRRFAVFNEAGQFYRIVGVAEDVTEHQEAAEKNQQQAAHLAHVARLSTMGELVAGIAHEVNQPLHTISNYTSTIASALAADGEVPVAKLRKWNDDISKAVMRAADIIKRTRAYMSKSPAQRSAVNLNLIVEESVELMAFEARRKRVKVAMDLPRPSPIVFADPMAIQQVIVNLLRNAFESMESTAVDDRIVHVTTRIEERGVEVKVCDRGSGLTEEAMNRLFTTFFTSKPEGMGMGLAISRTIIEAHEGQIWATRNDKHGVTFHVRLPLDDTKPPSLRKGT
jgi:PAS domain S-box-containing protein